MSEIYTLEQLRKMNQLDGSKKLIFVEQIKKVLMKNLGIKETPTDGIWAHNANLDMEDIIKMFKELGIEWQVIVNNEDWGE